MKRYTDSSLVSIVMPAFNASEFIKEAIDSVLLQSYENWELLIIDDGSTDNTFKILEGLEDNRIKVFRQSNKGVGAARNVGLNNMYGQYLCFLDADDVLPRDSILSRLVVFNNKPEVEFVDGWVEVFDISLKKAKRKYIPSFKGQPLSKLIELSDSCYFGLSWMIRLNKEKKYQFTEGMTHAEDLLFYISIAKSGLYDFVHEPVLQYRTGGMSAMSNLKGLEKGYIKLFRAVENVEKVEKKSLVLLWRKIMMVMSKSYLKEFRFGAAISFILRFFKTKYL